MCEEYMSNAFKNFTLLVTLVAFPPLSPKSFLPTWHHSTLLEVTFVQFTIKVLDYCEGISGSFRVLPLCHFLLFRATLFFLIYTLPTPVENLFVFATDVIMIRL
jgi:hypothetical protein